ncbi:MAG: wax ester/triacylglycerol synthase family O-acyltransferase, partial [Acidimicrobiales bacterium]|nr:wax ester/triacylglycerol synthase family O-acyltransferase [Acidimicrobiales bacterium]
MQQLTGVDATFLYVESPTTFGHVSSLIILDPRDGPVPGFDEIKALYQDRLHLLTPFRRRLVRVPFDLDHPYWVEDPDLDLDFHIRDTAVAPPGDDRQVAELVARLIARPLDRSRPLWELYLIHGLEGGRLGLLTKVHHAAIDGIGGAKLLASLLDLAPDADPPEPEALPDPETVPGEPAMLARGVWSLATRPYRSGRFLLKTAGELPQIGQALDVPGRLGRAASSMPQGMLRALGQGERRAEDDPDALDAASTTGGIRAPHTRFNGAIGPHRRFAFTSLPLSEVKAVKQALGVTVNDVVLGMCAGALRRYLDERGELPETS